MKNEQEVEDALFEAVSGITSRDTRQTFLDLIHSGNPLQSRRLGDMLAAQADADRFFRMAESDRTLIAVEAGAELCENAPELHEIEDDCPGRQIGRYHLLQRIGEGGCGVVYLAEQRDPVRRQVALKVIRLGMDTERVIARFESERQSLAMMDHPNIAHVLDAGTTERGRPFFVMEWVRGLRITEYCDENKLNIHQRIDLFMEVCKAIQHAHQKGIIHRDIKPSNILISVQDGKPSPKVIDFGVAKAIEGDLGTDTALTKNDQFVGTPAYMSPEQADQRQQDIDTRSDVYSLGMLLYELLVGRTPFDSRELLEAGLTEMRRILMESEPPAPSVKLGCMTFDESKEISANRGLDPSKLIASIKGDLDSVVMKAIEKDRRCRYETVNGFVMDLQRYIAHEPVIARPQSRTYLFRKFVRRNRVAVGASAGIIMSLLLGLGLASAFFLRERRSRQEQSRLRDIAEAAHFSELQRLAEAQEWENVAKVSLLLSEGKTKEADEILRETPISSVKLTPQILEVIRSLGNWNALRGRWPQAAECFMMLVKAEDLERKDPLSQSFDLLATGPVLVEGGNPDQMSRFREWALNRFGDSSKPLEVERLIHATLLVEADADYLRKLEPAKVRLASSGFDSKKIKPGWERESAIWRAFALALLEYRRGNFEQSRTWAEWALDFRSYRDHISAHLESVHAMSCFRLGDAETAKTDLDRAKKRLEKAFSPELPAAHEPFGQYQGYWWDWIIARILLREAEALIKG